MATSLRQWESDPLFSAAEVVQDSADRMESVFRHLLHEQALVQETLPHSTVHPPIEHTVRDLKTTLETTKWQLEDFERAVCLAAATDSWGLRADIIPRHEQFVGAIREQLLDVEKYLGSPSVRKTIESTDLMNLNERENDKLALFLSGGSHSEVTLHSDLDESSILRRFLDPTSQCGFSGSCSEIIEHGPEEIKNWRTDKVGPMVHDSFSKQGNGLRKVGSSLHVGHEARVNLKSSTGGYYVEDGSWDIESNEDKSQSFKQRKLKSDQDRRDLLHIISSLWCANVIRIRSLMRRWKDGEQRHHLSSDTNIFRREQDRHGQGSSWCGPFQLPSHGLYVRSIRFCQWLHRISNQRSLHNSLVGRHSMKLVLVIICTLVILAILAAHLA